MFKKSALCGVKFQLILNCVQGRLHILVSSNEILGHIALGIMKAWFFLVLLLIALSCEGGKKKKKGKKTSNSNLKDRFLRGPKATPSPTPAPVNKVNHLSSE